MDVLVDEEYLEFFNSLVGTLRIGLNAPATPVQGLMNLQAPPDARVTAISLHVGVPDDESDDPRPLTEEELDRVVFETPSIRMRGEADIVISHSAPNGSVFTIRDLLAVVEDTERKTRGETEWLGGIDVHHCYFEGLEETDDGIWEIQWGS